MKSSWQIATILGIPLKIHWTFTLLFAVLVISTLDPRISLFNVLDWIVFLTLLFFSVLIHELGHAVVAKKFHVKTKDIVFSPLGGVARLSKLPKAPRHEMYIALAGPLTNLVIGIVLGGFLFLEESPKSLLMRWGEVKVIGLNLDHWLPFLFVVNIVMFLFNLLPAFPMDGGRVVRAFLTSYVGRIKATIWASQLGRYIAVLLVVLGVVLEWYIVMIIGFYIFLSSTIEYKFANRNAFWEELSVDDVMHRQIELIDEKGEGISYDERTVKDYYLCCNGERLMGYVSSPMWNSMVSSPRNLKQFKLIDVIQKDFELVDSNMSLIEAFERLNDAKINILFIRKNNEITGYVNKEILLSTMANKN